MKRFLFFILTFCLLIIPFFSLCAETFEEVVDRHYENLAKIVFDNMTKPEQCLDSIGLYVIDAMEEVGPLKVTKRNEFRRKRQVKNGENVLISQSLNEPMAIRPLLPGQIRFWEAVEDFKKRFPEQAEEIFKMDIDYSLSEW